MRLKPDWPALSISCGVCVAVGIVFLGIAMYGMHQYRYSLCRTMIAGSGAHLASEINTYRHDHGAFPKGSSVEQLRALGMGYSLRPGVDYQYESDGVHYILRIKGNDAVPCQFEIKDGRWSVWPDWLEYKDLEHRIHGAS